jgi:signal peptidase II
MVPEKRVRESASVDIGLPAMRTAAHRLALVFALTLLVGCDHATKRIAKSALEGQGPRSVIRGVLDLRYTENTDVAFNLLRAVPERIRAPFLVVTGAAAVIVLLGAVLLRRGGTGPGRAAMLLITAGAVGNYLDRVARGYVVDFVHVPYWPVFNVADAYVVVGAVLLAWSAWSVGRRRQRISST